MRFALSSATLALAAALLAPTLARAGDPAPDPLSAAREAAGSVNGLCPVTARLVTADAGTATYRDEKIGFATSDARSTFESDPVRYLETLRADPARYGYVSRWPTTDALVRAKTDAGTANGLCPVMHRPVKKSGGVVEVEGQKIGFCCPGCVGKFRAATGTYLREMRADPTAYAYDRPGPTNAELRQAREAAGTANGLCPVMKRLVTARGGTVEYEGQKFGFCCRGCVQKFEADPAAFVKAMQAEPGVYGYLPSP